LKQSDFIDLLFPEAFVKKIDIKEITPCTADPDRIKFLAQADKPLGVVLPVLYLSIPNAKYSEKLEALSYRYKQHLVTIFSTGRIGMTYVKDRNEAEQLVEEVKNLINRAFLHLKTHGKPTPELIGAKKELDPMKIYEKLPKTNCRECGEQGCFAFAAKLLNSEKSLLDCPPITTEKYSTSKTQIEKMMRPIRI
jgi:ArsR family metal-binding transcriptional regulator